MTYREYRVGRWASTHSLRLQCWGLSLIPVSSMTPVSLMIPVSSSYAHVSWCKIVSSIKCHDTFAQKYQYRWYIWSVTVSNYWYTNFDTSTGGNQFYCPALRCGFQQCVSELNHQCDIVAIQMFCVLTCDFLCEYFEFSQYSVSTLGILCAQTVRPTSCVHEVYQQSIKYYRSICVCYVTFIWWFVLYYMHCPVWQILCNPAFVLQYK